MQHFLAIIWVNCNFSTCKSVIEMLFTLLYTLGVSCLFYYRHTRGSVFSPLIMQHFLPIIWAYCNFLLAKTDKKELIIFLCTPGVIRMFLIYAPGGQDFSHSVHPLNPQTPPHNRLLHMQPILCLVKHDRLRTVQHFAGDFLAPMGGQTMHKQRLPPCPRH